MAKKVRQYVAIDAKSFYASVECVERHLNPLTTNLVVADESRTEKTICLAVSPSLKAHGVPGRPRLFEVIQRIRDVNRERMNAGIRSGAIKRNPETKKYQFSSASFDAEAIEKDPTLEVSYIIAPPRMRLYEEYSSRIYATYLKYVAPEDIIVYSIDEVFMSTENEKRLLRCCFTGHRPGKLHVSEMQIKRTLAAAIESAYADGYRTFITGMAQGVDIWAGELVLEYRNLHPDIHIICALPHPDFEKRWSKEWQQRYNAILSQADFIKTVCDTFSYGAYQRRNEWMVNHSARVIAVYNGEAGGTRNTIEYAKKQGVSLVMIDG